MRIIYTPSGMNVGVTHLLAFLLITLFLSGCSSSSNEEPKPVKQEVVFWASNNSASDYDPLWIVVDDVNLGFIRYPLSSAPTGNIDPFDETTITVVLEAGKHIVKAYRNSRSAFWLYELTIDESKPQAQEFNQSNLGGLRLFFDTTNDSDLPVTIVLNQQDTLFYTLGRKSEPGSECSNSNEVFYVARQSGTYSYQAFQYGTGCSWFGNISISSNSDCVDLQLSNCGF